MQTDGASPLQGALGEVDRAMKNSPDPARALLDLTIEAVRQDDPELADAICYCAIPRRLDVEIVGVLRDASGDPAANEKLLAGLSSLHLVSLRCDGGYAYHDRRRALLLDQWRSDAEKRAQFDQFNLRLVKFYETQHKQAQEIEHDLERVKEVLLAASSNRYAQVAAAVRQRVLAPLFEALYHGTLRSAQDGYEQFSRYCGAYEGRGLLSVCELLRTAARENLEGLPPGSGQEVPLQWLEYWKARFLRTYRQFADAEKILRALLPKTGEQTKLRLWTLADLGVCLHAQTNLREASEFYQEELALAERTRQDPFNLPNSYSRVASMRWTLGELEPAAAAFRDAIACTRREPKNPRTEANSLCDLGGILQDLGKWPEAFNAALEGLHVARSCDPQDRSIQQTAAVRLMSLVASRDPALLDTLFKEAERLGGEGAVPLDLRSQYVNLLQGGGQVDRAARVLDGLLQDAASQTNSDFRAELLFRQASLQEARGALAESIACYDEVVRACQEGWGTDWLMAAAYSNQSLLYARSARWTESDSALQNALEYWRKIGHEKLAARIGVFAADALRRQGMLTEAQKRLDDASAALTSAPADYRADYHQTRANVYRDQAQWADAEEHHLQAASFYRSVDLIKLAAHSFADMAVVASFQGAWERAAKHAADAVDLWGQLAALGHYQPSAQAEAADEDNAEGMSHFFAPGENRRKNLLRARESFRAACGMAPDNFWYYLNLAHASAGLEDWPDAAQAVEKALDCAPRWLEPRVLREWLAEYRKNQTVAPPDCRTSPSPEDGALKDGSRLKESNA